MSALTATLDRLVMNPAFHDVLAILKGARNGLVYGARVRGPHALVMSLIFQSGPFVPSPLTVRALQRDLRMTPVGRRPPPPSLASSSMLTWVLALRRTCPTRSQVAAAPAVRVPRDQAALAQPGPVRRHLQDGAPRAEDARRRQAALDGHVLGRTRRWVGRLWREERRQRAGASSSLSLLAPPFALAVADAGSPAHRSSSTSSRASSPRSSRARRPPSPSRPPRRARPPPTGSRSRRATRTPSRARRTPRCSRCTPPSRGGSSCTCLGRGGTGCTAAWSAACRCVSSSSFPPVGSARSTSRTASRLRHFDEVS